MFLVQVKIYAKDLIDFLNRDWGTASMACVDMEYLGKFSRLASGVFGAPFDPDAIVDLDELNCVISGVVLKDRASTEPPFPIPIVTLVRLLQMIGIKDAGRCEAPSLRAHPQLLMEEPVPAVTVTELPLDTTEREVESPGALPTVEPPPAA